MASIYHEKQWLELCALHALNNLYQGSVFTKSQLDDICKNLSPESRFWSNPHRSWLGIGNYDINVITGALQLRDAVPVWFDRRRDPDSINTDKAIGFIVNIRNEFSLGPMIVPWWKRRHWFAIREIAGDYYNLDSKLKDPVKIGDRAELMEFLRSTVADREKQVFVVVGKDVEQDACWLNNIAVAQNGT